MGFGLFVPGGSLHWILIAFLIFPVLTVISMLICRLRDPQFPLFTHLPATGFGLAGWIVAKFLSQFFYFNGTGKEAGWRGFALPRLHSRVSPLAAGVAHASANTFTALFQPLDQKIMEITLFVFVAAIVLADRMWKRLPGEHPAVQKIVS